MLNAPTSSFSIVSPAFLSTWLHLALRAKPDRSPLCFPPCAFDTSGHFEVAGAPVETLLGFPVPLRANRCSCLRMLGVSVKDNTAFMWRSWWCLLSSTGNLLLPRFICQIMGRNHKYLQKKEKKIIGLINMTCQHRLKCLFYISFKLGSKWLKNWDVGIKRDLCKLSPHWEPDGVGLMMCDSFRANWFDRSWLSSLCNISKLC